jgi:hypothetical protein
MALTARPVTRLIPVVLTLLAALAGVLALSTPAQAEAACAVVPQAASTQQALESVKPLRIEKGLICAIDGYPSSGCAEQVKNATVPANEKPVDLAMPGESHDAQTQNSALLPLVGVGALVVLLGGGAVLVARRRR